MVFLEGSRGFSADRFLHRLVCLSAFEIDQIRLQACQGVGARFAETKVQSELSCPAVHQIHLGFGSPPGAKDEE